MSISLSIHKQTSPDSGLTGGTTHRDLSLGPNSTVHDLRKALTATGDMDPGDLFLLPSGFALAQIDETQKSWRILGEKDTSISILSSSTMQSYSLPQPEAHNTSPGHHYYIHSAGLLYRYPQKSDVVCKVRGPGSGPPDLVKPEKTKAPNPVVYEDIIHAAQLQTLQWKELYEASRCLCGVVLGSGPDDPGPIPAARQLIDIKNLTDCLTHSVADMATQRLLTVSTKHNHSYAVSGWSKGAIRVSMPFATAAVEANYKESFANNASSVTSLHASSQIICRARLQFDQYKVQLTPAFYQDLNEALGADSDEAKRTKLYHLFQSYGHVFATSVVLGGSLVTSYEQTTRGVADYRDGEISIDMQTIVNQIGLHASGGKKWTKQDNAEADVKMSGTTIIGGDQLLMKEPAKWISSLGDYRRWRIVKTEKVISILDLVPEYKDQILALAPELRIPALRGVWAKRTDLGFSYHGLKGYIPVIKPGQPYYWIGQSLDASRVLLVEELIPGALCEVNDPESIWSHRRRFPWVSRKTVHLIEITPLDIHHFASVGSCVSTTKTRAIWSQGRIPTSIELPWNRYRAVNRKLLVRVAPGEEKLSCSAKSGRFSIYSVSHIGSDKAEESSINSGLFVARLDSSPTDIWGLRADRKSVV